MALPGTNGLCASNYCLLWSSLQGGCMWPLPRCCMMDTFLPNVFALLPQTYDHLTPVVRLQTCQVYLRLRLTQGCRHPQAHSRWA